MKTFPGLELKKTTTFIDLELALDRSNRLHLPYRNIAVIEVTLTIRPGFVPLPLRESHQAAQEVSTVSVTSLTYGHTYVSTSNRKLSQTEPCQ